MKNLKKKSFISTIVIFVLILGIVSYLAADRYLIDHVEITNVSALTSLTASSPGQGETASTGNDTVNLSDQTEETTSEVFMADDWNYSSESASIAIKKISTGTGRNTVTYFAADIVLSDATDLSSAFAEDEFGTNIIEYTSQIAEDNNAIFAINGDYYGFRTDGIEIRNGIIFRDEPARVGLAFYRDGSIKIYDETQTSARELLDEGVWNTLSFGPALIINSQVSPNLTTVEVDTNFGNHSIQGDQPRTGVGIIDKNHYVFVVVDGRSAGYSEGVDLTEFAKIFKELGCTDAYNIDGGGSSTMYFMGRVVNNPLGKNKERGTSDILFIG